MRMCVRVCMRVDGINLKYALCWHINISVHSILCQCIHTSMHTHTLKSFEDGEPMGLKVHTATPIAEVVRANKKDDTTWNHILTLDTAQVNNQPLGHRAAVKWPQVPSNRESPLTTSSSADLASLVHRNQSRTVSPAHPKNYIATSVYINDNPGKNVPMLIFFFIFVAASTSYHTEVHQ